MAGKGQLRGALLEEVILVLLKGSGYIPVIEHEHDPTLSRSAAGLQVKGRGADHQIDAIADFFIPQPFTNPQRLLVEAKAYDHEKVGLGVVRNAVGVLKDVSEYWRADTRSTTERTRYSYQTAIFSTTGFSANAQKYAYAQNVYLLPLRRTSFLRPVLAALWQASETLSVDPTPAAIGYLRDQFRETMRSDMAPTDEVLRPLLSACRGVGSAMLGMIANRLPLFLVSANSDTLDQLPTRTKIRMHLNDQGWFLGPEGDEYLFSFDLPDELFEKYAKSGQISQQAALDMKEERLQTITAFRVRQGQPSVIVLELDRDWLDNVKSRIHAERDARQHSPRVLEEENG